MGYLREAPVLETTRVAWYRVVHDILPTNERRTINRSPTEACRHCGKTDTIGHRLTECGEGSRLWNWTKRRIATMLRTIPDHIPEEWLTHPQFKICPPQRCHAVLWMLAQLTAFRTQQNRDLMLQDFLDFLQRTRWKLYQAARGKASVGN